MRLVDIVPAAELNKSTTHRILQSLTRSRIVDQDPDTGVYFLGYDLFTLGVAAGSRFGLIELARPSLLRLAERTGDTVYLSIRERLEAVCIARMEGDFPIKTLTLKLGDRRPLGVGAGSLALLAFAGDDEISAIVAANFSQPGPFPRYAVPAVNAMIEEARRDGYAVNDGNVIDGMSAIGVPIHQSGRVVAALSVAAITERMRPPRRADIVTWLKAEAAEIERLLQPLGGAALGSGR